MEPHVRGDYTSLSERPGRVLERCGDRADEIEIMGEIIDALDRARDLSEACQLDVQSIDPWGLMRAAGFGDMVPSRELADDGPEAESAVERPPIGKVLLDAKVLTPVQLMRVLATQSETPKKRFGEIAVELGYCGEQEIEWALLEQLRTGDHPLDQIALRADTDAEEFVDLLLAYVHQLESRLYELDAEQLGLEELGG